MLAATSRTGVAARFGVALGDEGGAGFPRDDTAAGGASVVCVCSAPGLVALVFPAGSGPTTG